MDNENAFSNNPVAFLDSARPQASAAAHLRREPGWPQGAKNFRFAELEPAGFRFPPCTQPEPRHRTHREARKGRARIQGGRNGK